MALYFGVRARPPKLTGAAYRHSRFAWPTWRMQEFAHAEAFRFLQAGSGYTDPVELDAHFERVLAAFGFGPYSCVRLDERPNERPRILAKRGIDDWNVYYLDQGYADLDPTRSLGHAGQALFSWSDAKTWETRQGRAGVSEAMWSDAAQGGMNDGLIVRSVAPGGHVLMARIVTGDTRIRPTDKSVLDSVAICFMNWRLRLLEVAADHQPPGSLLSPREIECLRWAGQGLTDYAIADHMLISASTVNKHLESAKRKLGVQKRVAAFRRAAELGLLQE